MTMTELESIYGQHLPIFPCFYEPISEDRLERCVERLMDRADNCLMGNRCTQEQYDRWIKALDNWASSVSLA